MFSRYVNGVPDHFQLPEETASTREGQPPATYADRVTVRPIVQSSPFLDGNRTYVRHIVESATTTDDEIASTRRGRRDIPATHIDRSDTSYFDALKECGYTPMPLDPEQKRQLRADIAELNVPQRVADRTLRSGAFDTRAFDRQRESLASAVDEERRAHVVIERALRESNVDRDIFSIDYAHNVPDAFVSAFTRSLEMRSIVRELSPLVLVPESMRAHYHVDYLRSLMGSVGCKYVSTRTRALHGHMKRHIDSVEDRQFYEDMGTFESPHAHHLVTSNTSPVVILTFQCIGLSIDTATTGDSTVAAAAAAATMSDSSESSDDSEMSDDGNSSNRDTNIAWYHVELICHAIDDSPASPIVCFRTFRFTAGATDDHHLT